MNLTSLKPRAAADNPLDRLLLAANQVVLGKPEALRLAVTCLIAGGHLLVEDRPGVGKTTLAQTLARLSGLSFQRIQFTSDLLPADVLGAAIYRRETQTFELHKGPVFTQVLLADEINRATPRTQSALLEAMEERQVSLDGQSHPLPTPFFVIATQNPLEQVGTYPLPESQLDRFLMRISLGYPGQAAERELLRGQDRRALLALQEPILNTDSFSALQQHVASVHVADALLDYLQAVLHFTRQQSEFLYGLSPRAGLALLQAAKAWAVLAGRPHCMPEDLQAVLPSVAAHRLQTRDGGPVDPAAIHKLIAAVPVP